MSRRQIRVALAALVVCTACRKTPSNAAASGAAPPPAPAIAVEVAVASTDTVTDAIAATGQIEAVQSI